ncbi:hypothetical protein OF846_005334 [Rhodotorula toruloides]|nr:hypothetical protein OF846_005334 [Rhodotorula toruloides]
MAPREKGKGRASTSTRNASTSSPKPSLILQRGKRSFLIALPDTFADAIDETRRLFPRLDPDALLLEREVAGFGWVRLTDSGWESEAAALAQNGDGDKPVVLRVEVDVGSGTDEEAAFLPDRKRRRCLSPSPQPSNLLPASERKQRTSASPPHETTPSRYRLRFEGGEQMDDFLFLVKQTAAMSKIVETFANVIGKPRDSFRFCYAGDPVSGQVTFADFQKHHNIDPADQEVALMWCFTQCGGKPVIYLFPPTPLDCAAVSVILTSEWHFSALYPAVDPKKGKQGETSASWTVSAQPDGSLVDVASGLELKYLFWEAEAYKTTAPFPSHFAFDPSNPSLDASNGRALPFAAFLAHLDKTLAALSLHTAARNDFITYWLSHFNRIRDAGQHIGFRFLAQSDYERAARLDVDPKPDVVSRVFLLFKGVDAVEASEWKKLDEIDWVKEVGVQVDKVTDESLFRVLEWGGMEVV